MGVPQIIYIVLLAMGLGIYLVKHGEYRDGKYNFWIELISVAIQVGLLYLGGFFS